ncbi:MAG: ABC transporter substrate-binding protein, partial [Chloroflexota bacterium]|nr:ABC transporter substrate-binding protein [Chloroflexota bacterium]
MRKFMFLNLLVVLVMVLAACGGGATEVPATEEPAAPTAVPAPDEPVAPDVSTNQAPMLQELVASGDLPPLAERLPKDVQTVEVVESIGEYGGTWHTVTDNPGLWTIRMKLYDPPVRWKADYTGYEPGLAKSWEWSDDGKTITFHFREGVKW